MQDMTSNRPYLMRAFYDWILDNDCTPYIVVEADLPHVNVPPQTVKDGQVVLNVSPSAVHGLHMDNQQLTFSARFGGVPHEVYIPMYAISAIYAKENGSGTMFPPEEIPAEAELEEATDDIEDASSVNIAPVNTDKPIAKANQSTNKTETKAKDKAKVSHLSLVKK